MSFGPPIPTECLSYCKYKTKYSRRQVTPKLRPSLWYWLCEHKASKTYSYHTLIWKQMGSNKEYIWSQSLSVVTLLSSCMQYNKFKSCNKLCFNYRASNVVLTQEDIIHNQLRLIIIDVHNCNVNFDKWLQACRQGVNTTWLNAECFVLLVNLV